MQPARLFRAQRDGVNTRTGSFGTGAGKLAGMFALQRIDMEKRWTDIDAGNGQALRVKRSRLVDDLRNDVSRQR
jgi:hypothetical protein